MVRTGTLLLITLIKEENNYSVSYHSIVKLPEAYWSQPYTFKEARGKQSQKSTEAATATIIDKSALHTSPVLFVRNDYVSLIR